ncbi:MAG: alpha/beta hydrolase [Pseudomonadota bacterium]
MTQLNVNGLQIEYDTFGDPKDDPMLLIMGLGTQMTAWSPEFCNGLAGHGHYVIRFDNRDVGLSTKFDGAYTPGRLRYVFNHILGTSLRAPYSLEDMAVDAAGVLKALDVDSAHVVGASMGGMIAQLLTLRHPHRVKSLTSIMSSSGAPGLPPARPEVIQHVFKNRPNTGNVEERLEYMVRSIQLIGSPGYPRDVDELRELVRASLERSFYPQGFGRQLAAIVADGSRVKRLAKIDKPVLVIHGRDDPLVPVECGIDTANRINGAKLEIIEGMGHDLPPQLVDRLTSLIVSHAREVDNLH